MIISPLRSITLPRRGFTICRGGKTKTSSRWSISDRIKLTDSFSKFIIANGPFRLNNITHTEWTLHSAKHLSYVTALVNKNFHKFQFEIVCVF